jgi:hypothetical protein
MSQSEVATISFTHYPKENKNQIEWYEKVTASIDALDVGAYEKNNLFYIEFITDPFNKFKTELIKNILIKEFNPKVCNDFYSENHCVQWEKI